jgi:hypothetical protein
MDCGNKNLGNKIVDLASFKEKKQTTESLARGRQPLYLSHQDGKVTGSPHFKEPVKNEDFSDRILRIRASLEKINNLMHELKKLSVNDTPKEASPFPSKDRR